MMTDDEKAALADVYEKAAEYLETYGWMQGNAGQPGGPRCWLGATYSAAGQITYGVAYREKQKLWRKSSEFAVEVLELEAECMLPEWNDEDGRTQDEVINTLHGLANKLR